MLKLIPIFVLLTFFSFACFAQLVPPEYTKDSKDIIFATVGGDPIVIPPFGEEVIVTTSRPGARCEETRDFFYYENWNNGNPIGVFDNEKIFMSSLSDGFYLQNNFFYKGYDRQGSYARGSEVLSCTNLDELASTSNFIKITTTDILFEDGSKYLEYDLCYRESENIDKILIIDNNIVITEQGYFNEDGIITSDAYLATPAPIEVTGNGVISEPTILPPPVIQQFPKLYYFDVSQAREGDNLVTVRLNFHNGTRDLTINFIKKEEDIISQTVEEQEVCLGNEIEIKDFQYDGDYVQITSDNPTINTLIREENGKFYF